MKWTLASNEKKRSSTVSILISICAVSILILFLFKNEITNLFTCLTQPDQCLQRNYESKDENALPEQHFFELMFPKPGKVEGQKRILIYSLARSGSSFLGEIFNRHEDVFYSYEPLHTVSVFLKAKVFPAYEYRRRAIGTLVDLLNCEYENHEKYLQFISYPELSNPHFRLMSKALSSPPLCDYTVTANCTEDEYREHCDLLVPDIVETNCKRKSHIVVKELVHRFPSGSLSGLSRLFTDDSFKAIYLIRDPRAIIWSMTKIGWIGNHDDAFAVSIEAASKKVCQYFSANHITLNELAHLIHNKLIVIRYEDLVSEPVAATQRLFEFAQMSLTTQTIKWVVENTHGQLDSDNTKESFSVLLRNVSYSLNSWRKHLTYPQISSVQEECGNVMKKFGYVLFSTQNEIDNMHLPTFTSNVNIINTAMMK